MCAPSLCVPCLVSVWCTSGVRGCACAEWRVVRKGLSRVTITCSNGNGSVRVIGGGRVLGSRGRNAAHTRAIQARHTHATHALSAFRSFYSPITCRAYFFALGWSDGWTNQQAGFGNDDSVKGKLIDITSAVRRLLRGGRCHTPSRTCITQTPTLHTPHMAPLHTHAPCTRHTGHRCTHTLHTHAVRSAQHTPEACTCLAPRCIGLPCCVQYVLSAARGCKPPSHAVLLHLAPKFAAALALPPAALQPLTMCSVCLYAAPVLILCDTMNAAMATATLRHTIPHLRRHDTALHYVTRRCNHVTRCNALPRTAHRRSPSDRIE